MKYEVLNPFLVFRLNTTRKDYDLKKGDIVELPETDITVSALVSRRLVKAIPASPSSNIKQVTPPETV